MCVMDQDIDLKYNSYVKYDIDLDCCFFDFWLL